MTVLIAAQLVDEALDLADRSYILQDGRIVYEGEAADLAADTASQKQYLGIG